MGCADVTDKYSGGPEYAVCDRCNKLLGYACDLHELIQRRWTQGNEDARELSYSPHLTALLCPPCHRHFHDVDPSEAERNRLWRRLFEVAGRARVLADFTAVQDVMKTTLPIDLPGGR